MHNAPFECRLSIRDNHLIFLKSARPRRKNDFYLSVDLEQTLIKQSVFCRSLCGANGISQQPGSHYSVPAVRVLSAVHTSVQFRHRSPQHPRSRLAWMTLGGLQCTWLFLPFYFLNQNYIEDRRSVAVQGRECPLLSPCSPESSLLPLRALKRRLCLAASHFLSLLHGDGKPKRFNIIQA